MIWRLLLGLLAGLVVAYIVLLVALLCARPRSNVVSEALRLMPDVVRLVRRLASDGSLSRAVRWRLALLLAYLASPIDLIPDFIPVLGIADDAIVTAVVLRSVVRRAGTDIVSQHWPGTPDGLRIVLRLAGTWPSDWNSR